ncbi:bifunctional 2-keto-4-hydroxyglutarate aldolase/2-keto-3-deoxy-6-phosphogluconate aldolase [Christensenella tenuis]|jgi:2-dehydro-3-deoxyphosphogluconate aldolase / (4S)-4-hydroxy-2-oxoglutarate aldolase|uniref:Bifunctional 2-keto-4-hydroxyglutarate aldolase/2-keto-3-deoxy-6-phosphogluconate aldolase n=1 Tax=Christensenella tenuis TaxID=2763033 RepID=A0ABR7EC03_9FIRM|nr:bifunctional 2-keto-4-hydroxyglutarate aldolase/2-keto-3-deoxy-6-phosphogluconate aldolase [Christensenella tenuis]MBC5647295.1 bifunctional 2-keto-4-hydroxyglutarate aldolase/2-keto-3-deoxy-6-phosphogluconate aldolase [Christensenella tenuis]
MEKLEVLRRLEECGVVAVVRGNNEEEVMKIIDACIAGGIIGIEVTFTVPGAADIIKALAKRYDPKDVLIGAGTVLDPETARAAILAGAQFVVAPCLNVDTVKMCLRYQVACMPGAMTIKETVDCMEAGADIVKLFPGNLAGPKMIKNIKGPLPQVRIMPTGGVNAANAGEWIAAGAVAVGAGGDLTAGAKTGDYESITRIAKEMVAAVKEARK